LAVGRQSVSAGPSNNQSDIENEISAKDGKQDGEGRSLDEQSAPEQEE
jgi:hypothetical protein